MTLRWSIWVFVLSFFSREALLLYPNPLPIGKKLVSTFRILQYMWASILLVFDADFLSIRRPFSPPQGYPLWVSLLRRQCFYVVLCHRIVAHTVRRENYHASARCLQGWRRARVGDILGNDHRRCRPFTHRRIYRYDPENCGHMDMLGMAWKLR